MESSYQEVIFQMLLGGNQKDVTVANALLHLKVIETERVATAATDGTALLINPTFFDSLTTSHKRGLLEHEVLHVLFNHHEQFTDSGLVNHTVANYAMDDEINCYINASRRPPGGCHPSQIGCETGGSWIEYYAPRMQWFKDQQGDQQGDQNGSAGDDLSPKPQTGGKSGEETTNEPAVGDSGPKEGENSLEAVRCGVLPSGSLATEFYPDCNPTSDGDLTASENIAEEYKDTKTERERRMNGSRRTDHECPDREWVILEDCERETGSVGQRWEDVVIDAFRNGGDRRVDWSRRSRRCQDASTFMPGTKRRNSNSVALVVDVSGSCTSHFELWVRLMNELVESVSKVDRLEIVYHDTRVVQHETWMRSDGPITFGSVSGGGTSHRQVLEYVETLDVDSIIQFTDCETRWPDEDPALECVTVLPPNKAYYGCPFGINIVAN